MNDKYKEIIDLQHHISKVHKPMSLSNRGAQFAPFAALTGYDDMVKEQGIGIDERKELSDDEIVEINNKLNEIKRNDDVLVKYYRYNLNHEIIGKVTKYEPSEQSIMIEKQKILFNEIISIKLLSK